MIEYVDFYWFSFGPITNIILLSILLTICHFNSCEIFSESSFDSRLIALGIDTSSLALDF